MRERGASVRRLAKDLFRRDCGIGWSVWGGRETGWSSASGDGAGRVWGGGGSDPGASGRQAAFWGGSAVPGSSDLRGAGSGSRVYGELPVGGALSAAQARDAAGACDSSGRDAAGRFEERVPIGTRRPELELFLGTLSYSRAKFVGRARTRQLSWHTGHHECSGGMIPLWVRIDNPKTAVTEERGLRRC